MATDFEIDFALMAGRSYLTSRDLSNLFPVPSGWIEFFHVPNNPSVPMFTEGSGFEAISFQKGTEIVISFAGTYDKSGAPKAADAALGAGLGTMQLYEAAPDRKGLNDTATVNLRLVRQCFLRLLPPLALGRC